MHGDLAGQTEPKEDNPREAQPTQERMKPCSEGCLPRSVSFCLLVYLILEMVLDFPNVEPTVHQIPASLRLSRKLVVWG